MRKHLGFIFFVVLFLVCGLRPAEAQSTPTSTTSVQANPAAQGLGSLPVGFELLWVGKPGKLPPSGLRCPSGKVPVIIGTPDTGPGWNLRYQIQLDWQRANAMLALDAPDGLWYQYNGTRIIGQAGGGCVEEPEQRPEATEGPVAIIGVPAYDAAEPVTRPELQRIVTERIIERESSSDWSLVLGLSGSLCVDFTCDRTYLTGGLMLAPGWSSGKVSLRAPMRIGIGPTVYAEGDPSRQVRSLEVHGIAAVMYDLGKFELGAGPSGSNYWRRSDADQAELGVGGALVAWFDLKPMNFFVAPTVEHHWNHQLQITGWMGLLNVGVGIDLLGGSSSNESEQPASDEAE